MRNMSSLVSNQRLRNIFHVPPLIKFLNSLLLLKANSSIVSQSWLNEGARYCQCHGNLTGYLIKNVGHAGVYQKIVNAYIRSGLTVIKRLKKKTTI